MHNYLTKYLSQQSLCVIIVHLLVRIKTEGKKCVLAHAVKPCPNKEKVKAR